MSHKTIYELFISGSSLEQNVYLSAITVVEFI